MISRRGERADRRDQDNGDLRGFVSKSAKVSPPEGRERRAVYDAVLTMLAVGIIPFDSIKGRAARFKRLYGASCRRR